MEQIEGGSLSITEFAKGGNGNGKDRKPIPEGTYPAVYTGMKVFFEDTANYGRKKCVRLNFKITGGLKEVVGRFTSFKGMLSENKETGAWVIGSKSKLAKVVTAITNGAGTIDDTYKNKPVFVVITHSKSAKPDPETKEHKIWDFVTDAVAAPVVSVENIAPAASTPAPSVTPAVAAVFAPKSNEKAKAPVAPPANPDILGSLTEIGNLEDFKL